MRQNTFEKKPVEMLIEEIIQFEWRGPGPPGRTCTSTTGYFYHKTKICNKNFRLDYYLLLKYGTRQLVYLAFHYLGQIAHKS